MTSNGQQKLKVKSLLLSKYLQIPIISTDKWKIKCNKECNNHVSEEKHCQTNRY